MSVYLAIILLYHSLMQCPWKVYCFPLSTASDFCLITSFFFLCRNELSDIVGTLIFLESALGWHARQEQVMAGVFQAKFLLSPFSSIFHQFKVIIYIVALSTIFDTIFYLLPLVFVPISVFHSFSSFCGFKWAFIWLHFFPFLAYWLFFFFLYIILWLMLVPNPNFFIHFTYMQEYISIYTYTICIFVYNIIHYWYNYFEQTAVC